MCTSVTPAPAAPPSPEARWRGLHSLVLQPVRGRTSSPILKILGPAGLNGRGQGIFLLLMPPHGLKGNTISSPALVPSWLAHLHPCQENQLCCACSLGEVQCQLCPSHDLKARSPIHRRLRGAGNRRGLLFLAHSTAWQMRMGPDL